jgi:hypothetical protein
VVGIKSEATNSTALNTCVSEETEHPFATARRPANTGRITRLSRAKRSGLGTCCSPKGSWKVTARQGEVEAAER